MSGDSKKRDLSCELIIKMQKLKYVRENLQHQKRMTARRTINKKFNRNQATVYRGLKRGTIRITKTPSGEDIDSFSRKTSGGKKKDLVKGL